MRKLYFIVVLCYVYFVGGYLNNPMTNSIADLTVSLVDDHTLQIDPYAGNSMDVSKFQNHYYSGMPPGLSIVLMPIYLLEKIPLALMPDTFKNRLDTMLESKIAEKHPWVHGTRKRLDIVILLILGVFLISIPLAIVTTSHLVEFGQLIRKTAGLGNAPPWFPVLIGASMLLGTMVADFSSTLYHTTTAAFLLFLVFSIFAGRVLTGKNKITDSMAFALGAGCGFVPVLDYPALVYAFLISAYIFYFLDPRERVRSGFYYLAGFSAPILFLFLYHELAFGNPLTNAYRMRDPLAGPATPLINAELAREGWKVFLPRLAKLKRAFLDPWASVLIYNPSLVIALIGSPFLIKKEKNRRLRSLYFASFLIVFANFWFYCSLPLVVAPYVGSYGARYTLYSIPFATILLFPLIKPSNKWTLSTAAILLAIPVWPYLFYGAPPRTLSEYLNLMHQLGPANYTLTKAYEAGWIHSSIWAWVGFASLVLASLFILTAKGTVKSKSFLWNYFPK